MISSFHGLLAVTEGTDSQALTQRNGSLAQWSRKRYVGLDGSLQLGDGCIQGCMRHSQGPFDVAQDRVDYQLEFLDRQADNARIGWCRAASAVAATRTRFGDRRNLDSAEVDRPGGRTQVAPLICAGAARDGTHAEDGTAGGGQHRLRQSAIVLEWAEVGIGSSCNNAGGRAAVIAH